MTFRGKKNNTQTPFTPMMFYKISITMILHSQTLTLYAKATCGAITPNYKAIFTNQPQFAETGTVQLGMANGKVDSCMSDLL